MRQLVTGPWVIGRLRAALLLVVALAAVVDLLTFVVLVTRDPSSDRVPDQLQGPGEVAGSLLRAVADDRCDELGAMVADDASLPSTVTRCLEGEPSGVVISGIDVVGVTTTDDTSAATVAVTIDGAATQVVVDLVRVDGTWRVTGIRRGPSG